MLLIKNLFFFLKILMQRGLVWPTVNVKLMLFFAGIRGEGGRLDLLAGGKRRKNDKNQN